MKYIIFLLIFLISCTSQPQIDLTLEEEIDYGENIAIDKEVIVF